MFVCHDYPPATRAPAWETTVGTQRVHNIHVRDGIGESEFVAMRNAGKSWRKIDDHVLPPFSLCQAHRNGHGVGVDGGVGSTGCGVGAGPNGSDGSDGSDGGGGTGSPTATF